MIKEAIGTGTTVDEAKAAAMLELGISDFDEFTVEVLQTPTKKILGLFGGNPAKVKVSVNVPDPKPEKKQNKPNKPEKKQEKKPEKKVETKKQEVKEPVKEKVAEEKPMEETNLYGKTAEYIKEIVNSLGISECTITESQMMKKYRSNLTVVKITVLLSANVEKLLTPFSTLQEWLLTKEIQVTREFQ